jgi:hypothetical protein
MAFDDHESHEAPAALVNSLAVLRLLASLSLIAFGVVAVLASLEGTLWHVGAVTAFYLLVLYAMHSHRLYSDPRGVSANLGDLLSSVMIMLFSAAVTLLFLRFPARIVAACWSGLVPLSFATSIFSRNPEKRMLMSIMSMACSGTACVFAIAFLWVWIESGETFGEQIGHIPTVPLRVAAISWCGVAPISLVAAILAIRSESN